MIFDELVKYVRSVQLGLGQLAAIVCLFRDMEVIKSLKERAYTSSAIKRGIYKFWRSHLLYTGPRVETSFCTGFWNVLSYSLERIPLNVRVALDLASYRGSGGGREEDRAL